MNSKRNSANTALARYTVSLLSMAISGAALAQEDDAGSNLMAPPVMEETQVIGRLQTSAENLVLERQEQAVATDYIGADTIGRIGDSTVALALTRVPGVTLIDDKFVFVRGLGERYSSTTLNGAVVPSPDLSRNVLPLDMFPTSIVESLAVQKVPSADQPAAFGGGSVNIRTRGIPEAFVFSVELGTGTGSEYSEYLTYEGGDHDRWGEDDGTRALPSELANALDTYRGDFDPGNIADIDNLDSLSQAREVNRELASSLSRNVTVYEDEGAPDVEGEINLGNIFFLPNDMEFGFLAGAAYDSSWRRHEVVQRKLASPQEQVVFEDESVHSVQVSGNLSLGLHLNSENRIQTTSLFLRNTDDEVSVRNFFNSNRMLSDGLGFQNTELRYEQRELIVHQIDGEHELGGETLSDLNLDALDLLEGLRFNWYYSDSEATTDIPNEFNALSNITADPETGEALSSSLAANDSAATYRFSDLEDHVESYGWTIAMPVDWNEFAVEISGGTDYWQKARVYRQLEFYLGSTDVGNSEVLEGPLGQVLSAENLLNPENGFLIANNQGNANSYIAANKVNGAFGKIDVTWDYTLRLVLGTRWEDYQQVNLPWEPTDYDGSQFPGSESEDPEEVGNYFRNATYVEDDFYNSAALTWMLQDFWADDFQLRLSFGETTVRPDLREISDSSYLDPLTDIAVDGNPNVVPSQIDNYDLRGEWFFTDGDSFTLSLFYKDIVDPIELFEGAAADDNITAEIHNAESAEILGAEVELLKSLGDVADMLDPFFLQGNFTALDTELVAGDRADAPTNPVRPIQGASDQVANLILGFDSHDGRHAATLSYNMFSERLFFGGRNGAPDAYEQPFQSLDLTYSYYPLETLTVKFKVKNLLDDNLIIERTNMTADGPQDVEVYTQERGQDISLSVRYAF